MTDNPSDEPLNIQIDIRLDSYKSWFDHDWAKRLGEYADKAPKLSRYVQRLQFNWKVTARTSFMPWLVIDSIRGTTAGFNHDNAYQEQSVVLTSALNIRLMERLDLTRTFPREISPDLGQRIRQAISQELQVAASQIERMEIPRGLGEASPELIWKDFIENRDFQMGVWGSQVQAYSQVFFHYEHFLTRCVEAMELNLPEDQKIKGLHIAVNFRKAFDKHFGQPATVDYVTDPRIDEARLARHALAHNGGLLTENMKKEQLKGTVFSFDVDPTTEQIFIMPLDVASLFHYLKDKVSLFCSMVIAKPEFN